MLLLSSNNILYTDWLEYPEASWPMYFVDGSDTTVKLPSVDTLLYERITSPSDFLT